MYLSCVTSRCWASKGSKAKKCMCVRFCFYSALPPFILFCDGDWEHSPVLCVFSALPTTGFERHTSLVFNPSNPESSVEDCLAAMGDRVARELDTNLAVAVNTLLTGSAFLFCACEKCGALQHTVMAVFAKKKKKSYAKTCELSSIFIQYEKEICVHSFRATI